MFDSHLTRITPTELGNWTNDWDDMAQTGTSAEPFFQAYWFSAFARSFGSDREIIVATAQRDSKLFGVLPLCREYNFFGGIPARTLRSLSGLHSCRFDLCCRDNTRNEVAESIWKVLEADRSWDVLEAHNVPQEGGVESLMHCAEKRGFLVAKWPTLLSPYLDLPKTNQDPLQNCPLEHSASRSRLKNYFSKLQKNGKTHLISTRHFDERFIRAFIELEAAGWKGKHGGSIKHTPHAIDFYQYALRAAADAGHLRLYSLNVRDRPVAMEIGLEMNERFYSPKITYDESFSNCSPGQLLRREVLTDLTHKGVKRFDFLGLRARHKSIWTDHVRPHARCYIFRPSIAGHIRQAFTTRLAPRLRNIKYGWYGDPQAIGKSSPKNWRDLLKT